MNWESQYQMEIHVELSKNGAPVIILIFDWDVPFFEPSSFWASPHAYAELCFGGSTTPCGPWIQFFIMIHHGMNGVGFFTKHQSIWMKPVVSYSWNVRGGSAHES